MRRLVLCGLLMTLGCGPRKLWINPQVTDLDTVRVQVYECERDARSVQFFDPIVALLFRGMYYERCMRAHGYEKTPVE